MQTFNVNQDSQKFGFFRGVALGTGLEHYDPFVEGFYEISLCVGQLTEPEPGSCNRAGEFEELLGVSTTVIVDAAQAPQVP